MQGLKRVVFGTGLFLSGMLLFSLALLAVLIKQAAPAGGIAGMGVTFVLMGLGLVLQGYYQRD